MASSPHAPTLVSYLTALRERATQEIEARNPVELESQDTPEVVPPLIDVTVTLSPIPEAPGDPTAHRIFATLAEAFTYHAGRLVLLGRPGSGKTTTLWMFARGRVEVCLTDPTQPLPIFLKIDTWNRKTPIADWVRSQMPDLPLQNVPLLYLCDGLDELGGERPVDLNQPEGERFDPRADFLRLAEEQFAHSQFVISCRSAEYEEIRSKMHGCGAVTLLPLDEGKIEEFLTSWDRLRLWETLQNDPNLMELARTPLLLSLLTSAIGADGIDTEQDLRHLNESTLFRFYFDRRFLHEERKFQAQSPGQALPFDKVATQKLLGKLALYMWHWSYDPLTTLDRIEARFHLGAQADAFLDFACCMHFLRQSPDGHIAFIHLKFRDFCVIPALQQTLEDRSGDAQEETFGILFHLKEQSIPTLLRAAEHNQVRVRRQACSHLAMLAVQADPALQAALVQELPLFQRLLDSGDMEVHKSIIALLIGLGAPAMPALLQALKAEGTPMRYFTAAVLADNTPRIAPELHDALALAIPALTEALRSNERRHGIRPLTASAIARLAIHTDPFYFDHHHTFHYQRLVSGESHQEASSPDERPTNPTDPWLCEALKQTVPVLVAALKESDYQVHKDIEAALYHQRERALPDLLSALRSSVSGIRSAVISFLKEANLQTEPTVKEALLQSIPALRQELSSAEPKVCRTAVADLSEIRRATKQMEPAFREAFQQAVPGLLNLLYSGKKEDRSVVASLLSDLEVSVASILLQDLPNREAGVRRKMAVTLTQLATNSRTAHVELKQSMPALLRTLQDTDAGVRNSVALILTQLSMPFFVEEYAKLDQGAPALFEAIRHRDRRVRRAAVLILVQSGEQPYPGLYGVRKEVVPILLETLRQRDEGLRSRAHSAIHRLAVQTDPAFLQAFVEAVPAFLRKIKRRGYAVRENAANALGDLGPPVIPMLIQALQEKDYRVRRLAVMVLARLQEEGDSPSETPSLSAFELLLQALNDPEPRVRAEVAAELAAFGAEAIPPLLQTLSDHNARVRRRAASALANFRTAAVPSLLQALQEGEGVVRRGASSALLEMQEIVISEYEHFHAARGPRPDPALREALTQAAPTLKQTLSDSEAEVRRKMLTLIVRQEDQVETLLLEMLEDKALQVRWVAMKYLGYQRTAIPALLHLLQADRHASRWAAIAALYPHGYVPHLAFRPRVHLALRHRFGAKNWAVFRWLLALLTETSFLQRIPIRFTEAEAVKSLQD